VTYYQGGSLNTTWESTGAGADISVGVTLTFGGSSIRFDSYVNDLSTYNDLYSYAQVLVTDVVPYQLQLMYHAFNLGGGGFYYDSGD
jgi:hypothetical protein